MTQNSSGSNNNSSSESAKPPPPVKRHTYTWIIPLATVVIVIALVVGGLYLQAQYYPGEEGLPVPEEFRVDDARNGDELYNQFCAACHGRQGQGVGMFPPLVDTDWVKGDPDRLILVTLHGLTGPIEVRGEIYDFDYGMPAFQGRMSDQEMANLLTFIRTSWGHDSSPITAEQVRELREAHDDRDYPWTAEEL